MSMNEDAPNILVLPRNTVEALDLYAEDERKRMMERSGAGRKKSDDVCGPADICRMITGKSLAQSLLKNALIKQGYMYQNGTVKR